MSGFKEPSFAASCRSTATVPIAAAGRPHWIKVKNRQHPAMDRVTDSH